VRIALTDFNLAFTLIGSDSFKSFWYWWIRFQNSKEKPKSTGTHRLLAFVWPRIVNLNKAK
jgi:hypothetical protein